MRLEDQVRRFWETDMPAEGEKERGMSVEDQQVINLWKEHGRKEDRHFQLPIPFKNHETDLPNNWCLAYKRLTLLKSGLG